MGVLALGSAHARPSARPTIDMSANFVLLFLQVLLLKVVLILFRVAGSDDRYILPRNMFFSSCYQRIRLCTCIPRSWNHMHFRVLHSHAFQGFTHLKIYGPVHAHEYLAMNGWAFLDHPFEYFSVVYTHAFLGRACISELHVYACVFLASGCKVRAQNVSSLMLVNLW